jgi:hypothetical protein
MISSFRSRSAKFRHCFAPPPSPALQGHGVVFLSLPQLVKELMETDCGLFFARLLHVEKLHKCIIFGD